MPVKISSLLSSTQLSQNSALHPIRLSSIGGLRRMRIDEALFQVHSPCALNEQRLVEGSVSYSCIKGQGIDLHLGPVDWRMVCPYEHCRLWQVSPLCLTKMTASSQDTYLA